MITATQETDINCEAMRAERMLESGMKAHEAACYTRDTGKISAAHMVASVALDQLLDAKAAVIRMGIARSMEDG